MTNAQHAPERWRYVHRGGTHYIYTEAQRLIAKIFHARPKTAANARLIAAAPELLEELDYSTDKLKLALRLLPDAARETRALIEQQIEDNSAAIAKAKGE